MHKGKVHRQGFLFVAGLEQEEGQISTSRTGYIAAYWTINRFSLSTCILGQGSPIKWLNQAIAVAWLYCECKRTEWQLTKRLCGPALTDCSTQHSKAFHVFLLAGTSFMCAGLTSFIKNPINTTEAMQSFELTTERRLIKILAPCNAN